MSSTLPLSHTSLTSHRTLMTNLDDSSFVHFDHSYAKSVASSTRTESTADTDFSRLSTLSSISTRGNSPDPHPAAFNTSGSHAQPLKQLVHALVHSDLSDCWSEMAGVLLWIGLTASTASSKNKDRNLRRYFSALTVRASMLLCFEHPGALHATLLRMEAINKALRKESEDTWALGENKDIKRKRMKT